MFWLLDANLVDITSAKLGPEAVGGWAFGLVCSARAA